MSIGVAASSQRHGLGNRLLRAVILHAAEAGARAVHLEVATTNTAACALYARCGFKQVGLRKGYYATRNGRTDALLMRVELRS
jgi:ribosomal-protein-alanine N-acetyltransferase